MCELYVAYIQLDATCIYELLPEGFAFTCNQEGGLVAVGLPTVDSSKASQEYVLKVEPVLRLKQLASVSCRAISFSLPILFGGHACVSLFDLLSLSKRFCLCSSNAIDKRLCPVSAKNLLEQGIRGSWKADLCMDGGCRDD
jgi:hypothetical protein